MLRENVRTQLLASKFACALFDVDGLLGSKRAVSVLKTADSGLGQPEKIGKLLGRHCLAQPITSKGGLFCHD